MSILDRVKSLVVVNSNKRTLALTIDLRDAGTEAQRARFAGSQKAGYFYLHTNERLHPNHLMECVVSQAGDSITSLYLGHPALETPGELLRTREALIDELAAKYGLSHESVGIDDETRGRVLGLEELSTGQLIDMLSDQLSLVAPQTDNYGMAKPGKNIAAPKQEIKIGKGNIDDAHVLSVSADGSIVAQRIKDL